MHQIDPKNGPEESASGSSDSNRWDTADLDDLDYKNVFVDDGDAEERLPEFFDTSLVHKNRQRKDECQLCGLAFNKVTKKRYHCNYCGRSICDACS
jgi:biotin synthase-like enzyme